MAALAARMDAQVQGTRWYLFGSALNDPSTAADIDVLIVCSCHADADVLRACVDQDSIQRPLHLSILTDIEEAEVQFVVRQACVRLF